MRCVYLQDLLSILIDVIPAWSSCKNIRDAIKSVYAAETDFEDLTHTLLLKGLLEGTDSVLNCATGHMQEILHGRSIWKKIFSFRDPLPDVIQKIKNFQLFWRVSQFMQGQLFNSQFHVNKDYDAGDDAEFFQTGVLVFRCDVHLDILVTLCQDLGQLGRNKPSEMVKQLGKALPLSFPKTAKKLLGLKRMTQLVSYGDNSLPLGALNSLLKSSQPTDSNTDDIISRATKLATQYAENVCIRSCERTSVGFEFQICSFASVWV